MKMNDENAKELIKQLKIHNQMLGDILFNITLMNNPHFDNEIKEAMLESLADTLKGNNLAVDREENKYD